MTEIIRNEKGQFVKGTMRGNQFAKGNPPNRTSFKRGNIPATYRQGIQRHKNWGYAKYDIKNKKRISLSKYVYEAVYGKIKPGIIIYHKDGDKFNVHIENLEAITRAELLRRNKLKNY